MMLVPLERPISKATSVRSTTPHLLCRVGRQWALFLFKEIVHISKYKLVELLDK